MKPGLTFETFVIPAVIVLVGYRFLVLIKETRPGPDPWGPELDEALEKPEAAPLCHHCLAPQCHHGWFCPECGAAVGQFSNYLPNVYIFSIGEALRSGLSRRIRMRFLIVMGYLLVGFSYFPLFGPLYILALLTRNPQTSVEAAKSE